MAPLPVGGVDLRRGLSTALVVMFGVTLVTLVLVLIADAREYGLVLDFLDAPLSVSEDEIDSVDDFSAAMSLLNVLSTLVVVILWPIWFRRLRMNAEVFAPGQHRFGTGWAAGAWFTPVVNLWFPKQLANDIWRASSPQGPRYANRGLLNGWWTTWIVAILIGSAANVRYTMADDTVQNADSIGEVMGGMRDLKSALVFDMFALLVLVAAAILAILLIRQITAMQEQRATLPPGGPAPYGMPGTPPYGQPGPYPPYGQGPVGY